MQDQNKENFEQQFTKILHLNALRTACQKASHLSSAQIFDDKVNGNGSKLTIGKP